MNDVDIASEVGLLSAGELLELVRSGRANTRATLRMHTGMSRTAVASRVGALVDAGLLLPGGPLESTGGRPAAGLLFNRNAGVVLAAAIGRSRSQLAVLDLLGDELGTVSVDHELGSGPDEVMPTVVAALADLLEDIDAPILGLGMSIPGAVDPDRGTSIDSRVMRGWDGVELRPYFAPLGEDIPLFLGKDTEIMARSERTGHGAGARVVLVVKASTGLGLGILNHGEVLSGQHGGAGEIGHTKVDLAEGLACRCGEFGCLETIAGGWALVAKMNELGRPVDHIRDLVALAVSGDAETRQMLRESGRQLGEVLAVAINLLNPDAVVLGGDMAAAFDVYAAGVRESVYARASAFATRELRFVPASHIGRAGVAGCAEMALENVLSPAAVDAALAHATRGAAQ